MNSNVKTAVLWIVLICVAVLLWVVVRTGKTGGEQQLTFTDFMQYVDQGRVKDVTLSGSEAKGTLTDGKHFRAVIVPQYQDVYKTLLDKKVSVEVREATASNWVSILINAISRIVAMSFCEPRS